MPAKSYTEIKPQPCTSDAAYVVACFDTCGRVPLGGAYLASLETYQAQLLRPRAQLVTEAVELSSEYHGRERGNARSHWDRTGKCELALFVASMRDGNPCTPAEARRIARENA